MVKVDKNFTRKNLPKLWQQGCQEYQTMLHIYNCGNKKTNTKYAHIFNGSMKEVRRKRLRRSHIQKSHMPIMRRNRKKLGRRTVYRMKTDRKNAVNMWRRRKLLMLSQIAKITPPVRQWRRLNHARPAARK